MAPRRLQAFGFVCAVGAAVVFAGLWLHEREASARDTTTALVIELRVQKGADINMPIFLHLYDRDGRLISDVIHHGLPQVVLIPPRRYPVVVKAENGCSTRVTEEGAPLVDVTLVRRGCTARQVQ